MGCTHGARVLRHFGLFRGQLEAKYPSPALLPSTPEAIATLPTVQLVTVNELVPAINPLIKQMMGFGNDPEDVLAKAEVSLTFYADKLGDKPFFCGDQLTLADIVAGTYAPWFEGLGLPMAQYPTLATWISRPAGRPPSPQRRIWRPFAIA